MSERQANIAGVKFHPTGRTFEFDAGPLTLRRGDTVVIQDDGGVDVATVAVGSALRPTSATLARVLRVADERDLQRVVANRQRANEALAYGRELVRTRQLPLKMFRAEFQHGGGRATFYFASETRIDFRDLVRELSTQFHVRVDMRQVGVRDEAKMVGGIGSCGRELCCSTFLPRFAPVSIKMAKHQNLVLNPTKVSGQCGRLKCCLVYEEATYVEMAKGLPKAGKRVTTPDGIGRVGDLDVLQGRIRVYFEDQPPKVYVAGEVQALHPPGHDPAAAATTDDGDGSDHGNGNGGGDHGSPDLPQN
ncbi:MAG TPA: regulatory iron-sulfur-containing complex subunit RicT [Polyangia bacterium]|jgi:cell fate regulator YaaT (PSP1 superfamily)|nr:regulatory iron-sulfur-containing complex subunit RicT [Polyangia bacterium]